MLAPQLQCDAARGVHRLEHATINAYLIEDDTGTRVVSGAATAASAAALASLTPLFDTGAQMVLPGHGEPLHLEIAPTVHEAPKTGA